MGTDIATSSCHQNFRHALKLSGKSREINLSSQVVNSSPVYTFCKAQSIPATSPDLRTRGAINFLKEQPCHVKYTHGQQSTDRNSQDPGPQQVDGNTPAYSRQTFGGTHSHNSTGDGMSCTYRYF